MKRRALAAAARDALVAAYPELAAEAVRTAGALNGYWLVPLLTARTFNTRWRMYGLQGIGTLGWGA